MGTRFGGVVLDGSGSGVAPVVHKLGWYAVRSGLLRAFNRAAGEYRLPADSWLVFEWIGRLCWHRSKLSTRHAAYCVASEAWLGSAVGCRRETVSQHVWRLANMGLLTVLWRRKSGGRWQTNLYRLAPRTVAALQALMKKTARSATDERQPYSPQRGGLVCASAHAVNNELGALVSRWLERGKASGEGGNG